jgi:hypothetical protein
LGAAGEVAKVIFIETASGGVVEVEVGGGEGCKCGQRGKSGCGSHFEDIFDILRNAGSLRRGIM